jgi:hypothetical protein
MKEKKFAISLADGELKVVVGREVTLPNFPNWNVFAYKKYNKHNREYAWIVVDVRSGRSIDYGYPLDDAINHANQRMLRHLTIHHGSIKQLMQTIENSAPAVPTVEEVESNG